MAEVSNEQIQGIRDRLDAMQQAQSGAASASQTRNARDADAAVATTAAQQARATEAEAQARLTESMVEVRRYVDSILPAPEPAPQPTDGGGETLPMGMRRGHR